MLTVAFISSSLSHSATGSEALKIFYYFFQSLYHFCLSCNFRLQGNSAHIEISWKNLPCPPEATSNLLFLQTTCKSWEQQEKMLVQWEANIQHFFYIEHANIGGYVTRMAWHDKNPLMLFMLCCTGRCVESPVHPPVFRGGDGGKYEFTKYSALALTWVF